MAAEESVNKILTHLAEFNPMVSDYMKMLNELVEDIKQMNETVEKDEVDQLRNRYKDSMRHQFDAVNLRNLTTETKEKVRQNIDVDFSDTFSSVKNENDEARLQQLIQQDNGFRMFERALTKIQTGAEVPGVSQDNEDDEDENNESDVRCTQMVRISMKDPFTQKQIVDGVRNKRCNHVYERAVMQSLLENSKRKRKKLTCPYVGCGNRNPITVDDLEDYLEN